ncbi:MAG: FUN14 domain-containing protein [Candidatus Babeliaceae bacterium]
MKEKITGWFTALQNKLKDYPSWVLDICLYGIFGLVIGFLCKNIGRYLFFGVLGMIAFLWILNTAGFATIDTARIKDFLGLSSIQTIDDLLHMYIEWVRAHLIGCIAFIIAFFCGWKLT